MAYSGIVLEFHVHLTYPNFPVDPKTVCDRISGLIFSSEVPVGTSATCTNADSYPPDISLASMPAALFDRGFYCNGVMVVDLK